MEKLKKDSFSCVDRESNPGHSLGKAVLYHSTTDAKTLKLSRTANQTKSDSLISPHAKTKLCMY